MNLKVWKIRHAKMKTQNTMTQLANGTKLESQNFIIWIILCCLNANSNTRMMGNTEKRTENVVDPSPPYHAIFVSLYYFFPVELPSHGQWSFESGDNRKSEIFSAVSYCAISHHINYHDCDYDVRIVIIFIMMIMMSTRSALKLDQHLSVL